jgi:hypothetical protein
MLKIAFDCQGVLIDDGPTPAALETRIRGRWMPDLVATLITGGAEVHCISAAPENHPFAYEALCKLMAWHRIPLHGIWPAFHPLGETAFEIGCRKAQIMEQIGCAILFDDNPQVAEGVRSAGKIAIVYSTGWEK